MKGLVLSGVRALVLLGVSLSCYQACESSKNTVAISTSARSNSSNLRRKTDSRNAALRWTTSSERARAVGAMP